MMKTTSSCLIRNTPAFIDPAFSRCYNAKNNDAAGRHTSLKTLAPDPAVSVKLHPVISCAILQYPALTMLWLMLLGVARNGLEVACGIDLNGHWYSWAPDVVWSMLWFPFFLCFYGGLSLWACARSMGVRVDLHDALAIAFWCQLCHLVIPLIDWVGIIHLGLPKMFHTAAPTQFYMRSLVFTPGIIAAWCGATLVLSRWLRTTYRVPMWKIALILIAAFQPVFWTVYIFPQTFNTVFGRLIGLSQASELYYGYGMFFLLAGLPGFIWWNCHARHAPIRIG